VKGAGKDETEVRVADISIHLWDSLNHEAAPQAAAVASTEE
jgi:hypothetical protein